MYVVYWYVFVDVLEDLFVLSWSVRSAVQNNVS